MILSTKNVDRIMRMKQIRNLFEGQGTYKNGQETDTNTDTNGLETYTSRQETDTNEQERI